MNSVIIVLPILTILMFDLGLVLKGEDFLMFIHRPKPVICGLVGQIIILPLLAFVLGIVFHIDALFFIGLMLVACSPGGSSSNVFSMIAKGDVALSVSLTALSSLLTLVTIPIIMSLVTSYVDIGTEISIHLPVGKLIVQNIILSLVPVIIGIFINKKWSEVSARIHKVLSKAAFPLLILLASVFFIGNYQAIFSNFVQLGLCTGAMILLAMSSGFFLSKILKLNNKEERTIVIEVGMQNAAQAIAIATSPFVFNNNIIAVPAIVYALLMNIILLTYISIKNE